MIGPLSYIGGKRRIAARIASLIPPHTTYVEPFAGGAQVFFHKAKSYVEVLNDVDSGIVNFLRVCQDHDQELSRWLRHAAASRRMFELFSQQRTECLTDIQRAARFLYLQKNCFGGRRHTRSFRFAVSRPKHFRPDRLPELLHRTAQRLIEVQIESLPYEQILPRYDRPTTFFYCDPPYQGLRLYQHNFTNEDFELLAQRLAEIRGTFLLSINDTPVVRRIFSGFHRSEIELSYSSSRLCPRATELMYSNYVLPSY